MALATQVFGLAFVAWLVPWGLGKLMPEGVGWLVVTGVLSAVVVSILAAIGFAVLYGDAGGVIWREAPLWFFVLSLRSALIWGPIVVLTVANIPRGWTEVEW